MLSKPRLLEDAESDMTWADTWHDLQTRALLGVSESMKSHRPYESSLASSKSEGVLANRLEWSVR